MLPPYFGALPSRGSLQQPRQQHGEVQQGQGTGALEEAAPGAGGAQSEWLWSKAPSSLRQRQPGNGPVCAYARAGTHAADHGPICQHC